MSNSESQRLDQTGMARFADQMRAEGLPEISVRAFLRALEFVSSGGETTIPEDSIRPVDALPDLADLSKYREAGLAAVSKAVVIKLNGGLGTSMGLARAKSLLPIRPGISFLDLIARQIIWQREHWNVELPLVLMNSERTRDESLSVLEAYPELESRIPADFLQHKVPRIDAESWMPVEWAEDRSLDWCPPGHGDLYPALASSGMLDALRSNGIRYAFVSNADNLGAVLDLRILGWFTSKEIPFALEVAERTESDKKGGHLALRNGRLILREIAQCSDEDMASFQDIRRHHYFNTNNLWLDLDALAQELDVSSAGLPLPVIQNEKHVSAVDSSSPLCIQLETAMGSAIECFENAAAIRVSRTRFAPVKTTSDLLSVWSDAYRMTEDARMVPVDPEANQSRVVELDSRYFGHVDDLQTRFSEGVPSLANCRRFSVSGDHYFGANVSIEGSVHLVNDGEDAVKIPSGTVLTGPSEG